MTVRLLRLLGAMSLLVGCAMVFLVGCASTRGQLGGLKDSPSVSAQKVEPEARSLFNQGEKAFAARKFDEARKHYSAVKQKFPKSRAWSMATYRLGTIHYYQEEYPSAAREFDAFLARNPTSELTFDVTYNYAAAEYQQGHYERAYQALSRLSPQDLRSQGPRRAEVVFQLTAQTAAALNLHSNAIAAYSQQVQLPMDDNRRGELLGNVDYHLGKMSSVPDLDRLQDEVNEPLTKKRIGDRIAQLLAAGRGELASSSGNTPVTPSGATPTGELAAQALGAGSSADRLNVGVLLPLTGEGAAYGKRALDGILLAAGHYLRNQPEQVRLFIEDTGGNPAQAQQGVDRLVNQHKVMAIIGPVSWKESIAVAERAQQLGVLNLSLTSKEGISERGAYLFQNAMTPRVQLEGLVQHCIQNRDMKRFAILAPNNPFGKDMTNEFWSLVERFGGRIVGYKMYDPAEKDFQGPVREITGLQDPRFRKMEQAKLTAYMAAQKLKNKRESKARLPPIVDFDAIFIPDQPKTVAQIASSLAYFDVQRVALLGTTEWNSDQLYKRGGRYVEGAMFPGGVSLASRSIRQKDFIRLYAESYGASPDLLAGQAYEAMEMIGAAIRRSSSDRNDLVNQLASMRDFETPLGNVSFDSTRIAKRKLPVFQIEAGGNISQTTN